MAIYSAGVRMAWRGNLVMNVHHYSTTNPLSDAQQDELAQGINDAYDLLETPGNDLDDDWELNAVDIRRVDLPDLPSARIVPSSPAAGTSIAANATANQVALLVSFSARTTKPRRGRSYLAGFVGAETNDGGTWGADATNAAAAWAQAIMTITLTGDTAEKVAVTYTGTPPRVTVWNVLTDFAVTGNPAIQRRRRLGQGV